MINDQMLEERVRRRVQDAEFQIKEGDIPEEFRDAEQVMTWSVIMRNRALHYLEIYEVTGRKSDYAKHEVCQQDSKMLADLGERLWRFEHKLDDHERMQQMGTDRRLTSIASNRYISMNKLLEMMRERDKDSLRRYVLQ